MDKKNDGRIWPYAIGGAITLVFGFCVATIVVTSKADIQKSNAYMTYYQDADSMANEFIEAKIKFDKKYKVSYINNGLKDPKEIISAAKEGYNNFNFYMKNENGKFVKKAI